MHARGFAGFLRCIPIARRASQAKVSEDLLQYMSMLGNALPEGYGGLRERRPPPHDIEPCFLKVVLIHMYVKN